MKNLKKIESFIFIIIVLIICPICVNAFVAQGDVAPGLPRFKVVSKNIAMLLTILPIMEWMIPVLFVLIKLVINQKKQNHKNTVKNLIKYILIAIIIFGFIFKLGDVILEKSQSYGYSSKTVDYIEYHGKNVYYHK